MGAFIDGYCFTINASFFYCNRAIYCLSEEIHLLDIFDMQSRYGLSERDRNLMSFEVTMEHFLATGNPLY